MEYEFNGIKFRDTLPERNKLLNSDALDDANEVMNGKGYPSFHGITQYPMSYDTAKTIRLALRIFHCIGADEISDAVQEAGDEAQIEGARMQNSGAIFRAMIEQMMREIEC